MIFGIYSNLNKDRSLIHTKGVIDAIAKRDDCSVIIHNGLSSFFPCTPAAPTDELCSAADVVITLGGDGTILKIASQCALNTTPILGINLGTLGFLTEAEPEAYDELILKLASHDYTIENRTMLKSTTEKGTYYSLNEIMVGHSRTLKMVPTDVYVDGNFYYCYYADGVMVATPTGSTGYSLSAGGPVLSPALNGFVINGVCPHSLQNKPVVIGSDQTVTLRTSTEHRALLTSDGDYVEELEPGASVTVQKAEYEVGFIRLSTSNFYERLINKLNHWSNFSRREK